MEIDLCILIFIFPSALITLCKYLIGSNPENKIHVYTLHSINSAYRIIS